MPAGGRAAGNSSSRAHIYNAAAAVVLLLIAGVAVLWMSWRAWPDVQTDFGRELYVPWRIAEHGEVLYRDIAYYNGPLSSYVNALAFRAFGTSLLTLVWLNIVLAGLLSLLIIVVLRGVASRLAAVTGALMFVLVFACGQLVAIGNYNFICPYSHELTHGILLAFAGMAALFRYHATGRRVWLMLAGLALGLTFLTKIEASAAASLALVIGVSLTFCVERRAIFRGALCFIIPAVVPPVVAFALLAAAMPPADAFRGTLGSWWYAFDARLRAMPFFRTGMGTDDVARSLRDMALWSGGYVAVLFVAAVAARLAGRRGRASLFVAPALFFVTAVPLIVFVRNDESLLWMECLRPLPVVLTLAGVAFAAALLRRNADRNARLKCVRRLVLVVFAAVLLGKVLLAAKAYHYGFALALPATLVLIAALLDWLPSLIGWWNGSCGVFRAAGLAVLGVFAYAHVRQSDEWYAAKTFTVGTGADAFRTREIGEPFEMMRVEINHRVAVDQTLFAMPEGIMLNYLCRRAVPTPYLNTMPAELIYFGEANVAAALEHHPPDFIALVHKDTSEYGPKFFGRDYAGAMARALFARYQAVKLIGAAPFAGDYFGILLLQRVTP